jgi:hypothetical protein
MKQQAESMPSPPSWVNTRGLDAETLLEVAMGFDRELWTEAQKAVEVSYQSFAEFLYRACQAFQEIHAATDWDTNDDYWGTIDTYIEKINAAAAGDHEWLQWNAEKFKQINSAPKVEDRELEAGEGCERCGKPATEIRRDEALCTDCAMEAEANPRGFYGENQS